MKLDNFGPEPDPEDLNYAAKRDASLYARPRDAGDQGNRQEYIGRCHITDSTAQRSVCGIALAEFTVRDIESVPLHARCQRLACRKHWPREGEG